MCAHVFLRLHRAKNKQKNELHVNTNTNTNTNTYTNTNTNTNININININADDDDDADDISGKREKIYLLAFSVCSNYWLCICEMTKRIYISA